MTSVFIRKRGKEMGDKGYLHYKISCEDTVGQRSFDTQEE